MMAVNETIRKMRETVNRPLWKGHHQEIELTFFAPEAKKVFLAGTFNGWNTSTLPMKKDVSGTWRVKIKMPQGRHEYKYFIDGTWAQDIPGSEMVLNPFGTYNCVIGVE